MRFHWLQHVPFENAANVGVWAERRGYAVTGTKLYTGEPVPEVGEIDALAIMGGPMNIYQHRDYPWLIEEKRFIERAIRVGMPILGVCLGAQLVADVLGAKVTQNAQIEIGWFDVTLTAEAADSQIAKALLPERFGAFHWHGDTFGIPAGATRLAESEACANQAFEYASNVLALQFHLDYSAQSIEKMLAHCGHELVAAPFVQDREQIVARPAGAENTRKLLWSVLDSFLGRQPAS